MSVRAIKQQIYRIFNDREFQKKVALFYLGYLMKLIVMGDNIFLSLCLNGEYTCDTYLYKDVIV